VIHYSSEASGLITFQRTGPVDDEVDKEILHFVFEVSAACQLAVSEGHTFRNK
jgi:hypothetical protein